MNGKEETSSEENDALAVGLEVFRQWLEETDDIAHEIRRKEETSKEAAGHEETSEEENGPETPHEHADGFRLRFWGVAPFGPQNIAETSSEDYGDDIDTNADA